MKLPAVICLLIYLLCNTSYAQSYDYQKGLCQFNVAPQKAIIKFTIPEKSSSPSDAKEVLDSKSKKVESLTSRFKGKITADQLLRRYDFVPNKETNKVDKIYTLTKFYTVELKPNANFEEYFEELESIGFEYVGNQVPSYYHRRFIREYNRSATIVYPLEIDLPLDNALTECAKEIVLKYCDQLEEDRIKTCKDKNIKSSSDQYKKLEYSFTSSPVFGPNGQVRNLHIGKYSRNDKKYEIYANADVQFEGNIKLGVEVENRRHVSTYNKKPAEDKELSKFVSHLYEKVHSNASKILKKEISPEHFKLLTLENIAFTLKPDQDLGNISGNVQITYTSSDQSNPFKYSVNFKKEFYQSITISSMGKIVVDKSGLSSEQEGILGVNSSGAKASGNVMLVTVPNKGSSKNENDIQVSIASIDPHAPFDSKKILYEITKELSEIDNPSAEVVMLHNTINIIQDLKDFAKKRINAKEGLSASFDQLDLTRASGKIYTERNSTDLLSNYSLTFDIRNSTEVQEIASDVIVGLESDGLDKVDKVREISKIISVKCSSSSNPQVQVYEMTRTQNKKRS